MTVKEFVKLYAGIAHIDVELYEINENVQWNTDTDELSRDDDLHNEWKNAVIQSWDIGEYHIILNVIK